jgi:hypothetical protein
MVVGAPIGGRKYDKTLNLYHVDWLGKTEIQFLLL